ncbi:ABC transporter substrate-binding protein [Parahaliea maris]|uniref:ABC transporter substrate-binding protein n=1 Tax=Parahaliea maris TaxID=2716870 RepID=A0A5C9A3W9_9GAMM|nr:CmpA/NrtA family ABC transporter substrate-binding protein [Parahaliea maris]TXS95416.1 ABC transporter substrate-binding protein [Parahaliea maris]
MSEGLRLPAAEKRELRLGYLRLNDSAPLVMAQELGFYERYGLDVTLEREISWANLRDKLVIADLDAAQMLAPLPIATSLGVGGMRADVITGLALSLNGNAITVSRELATILEQHGGSAEQGARSTALALGRYLSASGTGEPGSKPELTFASAHTFSCHTFFLRLWLQSGGVDPEHDVRIIVLPPEQMVDSLARGIIDGYCVGEPWSTVAVQQGIGAIQATGYELWNNSPEKVLAVTESWHRQHTATHLRLRLALMETCRWLSDPVHRLEAAEVLARPEYLDLPVETLRPALAGALVFSRGGAAHEMPDFHVFGRYQAGFPWRSDGEWLAAQSSALLGKTLSEERCKSLVQQTCRTDLYREAARYLSLPAPATDYRPVNAHSESWEQAPGITLGADHRFEPPF